MHQINKHTAANQNQSLAKTLPDDVEDDGSIGALRRRQVTVGFMGTSGPTPRPDSKIMSAPPRIHRLKLNQDTYI